MQETICYRKQDSSQVIVPILTKTFFLVDFYCNTNDISKQDLLRIAVTCLLYIDKHMYALKVFAPIQTGHMPQHG